MSITFNNILKIFSLEDEVAIITGGARGNGNSIAKGFLAGGAIVYLVDILKDELEMAREDFDSEKCHIVCADVTDADSMNTVLRDIYEKHNKINILVNNAGVTCPDTSETYPIEKWNHTHRVNLEAPFRLAQMVFPYMKMNNGGVIINITSLNSEVGGSNNPAYISSKGGLKLLTKALAKDWAKYNIRINNLGLGYFKTDMTKRSYKDTVLRKIRTERIMLNRWGGTEDIVGPSIFLASPAAQYITGQDIYVDGGVLSNGI